ncbi:MAG TPA: biopolymer transporter ExbD [Planctomycetota bacterium]|nr:biopolymer transporter ExbD [Planctomycetota bacterium]
MALKKHSTPTGEAKVDLTPMIDVTFQLIIFFVLVTDMSQRELEVLTLPMAPIAVEDVPDPKDERIVVNIVDLDNPEVTGNKNLPPIFIQGRQMTSLEEMRKVLFQRADPRRYPDTTRPPVSQPPNGPLIYPSSKPLLIRCDQHQVFGWVQAVMQYCSFVPGNPQNEELANSPFIYKIEIGARRKDASEVDPATGK